MRTPRPALLALTMTGALAPRSYAAATSVDVGAALQAVQGDRIGQRCRSRRHDRLLVRQDGPAAKARSPSRS
ncbi:hypothetical protein [Massilia sp. CCM 8734]|uniref:hypothetical protein n=1 Tax=Massilia sp. CCM 8734 TaxID=2609283 RepID=UPI00141FE4CB|nr:hypothetical protein [Massilia sp. CCM 8734]NHZ98806.1 hypothetical protein [Massilia sp. CCM 8734]